MQILWSVTFVHCLYTITPVKRSTGVKRSCEVDSEVKPAKYVCVDKESIQVSDDICYLHI